VLDKWKFFGQKNKHHEMNIWDKSTLRIIVFASIVIILSILLTGGISYFIAKSAVINKLKTKDLIYIARSITAKIDGRIARAKELSEVLSKDPVIIKWIDNEEKDNTLGQYAMQKITDIAQHFDYSNSFIVSAKTHHYWAEGGKLIDTLSPADEDDAWFYSTISSKQPVSFQIDYNKERKDTFVFVNALIGDKDSPIAITGVGLNLKDIAQEFESYKFGEQSNMWLIDNEGNIYLSEDLDHVGKNIAGFIPEDIARSITLFKGSADASTHILEYKNARGKQYDLIYESMTSTDWKLVLQIPRKESEVIVDTIKINTAVACIVAILAIMLLFYIISNKIADPYKRALLMKQELENEVDKRTQELNEKNTKIMDSIEYAKIIQESILPLPADLAKYLGEHFVLWKPRDIVGGDIYFAKKTADGIILIVGDCTGHGVPGALMTMAVNSILNHIIENKNVYIDPAFILKELNCLLKRTLIGRNTNQMIDDGLDAGVVFIPNDGNVLFAGAKISLYFANIDGVKFIKGDNKGIGYKKTNDDYEFSCISIENRPGTVFYLTTDGYLDQNGGERNLSLGRKSFEGIIKTIWKEKLKDQKTALEEYLTSYMNGEEQRDDITVIGFKLSRE
jgi:serine phosphatase RsbU (regulator of sigma subunit)